MIISFASGKGGTGKTTIATNFALYVLQEHLYEYVSFFDCDVEEPNAGIFLRPVFEKKLAVGILVPLIDRSRCTYCGMCAEICAYNAIAVVKDNVLTFPELCHGCGGCRLLCPEKAISEVSRKIGEVQIGASGEMRFIQGQLNIGEPMSPPLIRAVKEYLPNSSSGKENEYIAIVDAPPGTSCPVIESVKYSDFTVLVTEPSPFGLHDLKLAVEALRALTIPCGIVLNRDEKDIQVIDDYCEKEHLPILMRVPFDREIAVAYSKGIPFIQLHDNYRTLLGDFYKALYKEVEKSKR